MSQVINPCARAIWYQFRWCAEPEQPEGTRQRRFETGEVYEQRLLNMLAMVGANVVRVDPATGKQTRAELAHGHLRGKLDATATRVPTSTSTEHVVECKSKNSKGYKAIIKGKIRDTAPDHHAQTQLYMHALGLKRGVYLLVNKDTDEIHDEIVEYDPALCAGIVARVEGVVNLTNPPARLHDDPNSKGAIECKKCPARGVCHEGVAPRRNCRTCIHVTPEDGPRWVCELHGHARTYEAMQAGCDDHRMIPALVNGEQIDADPEAGTITYRMSDGSEWIDGRAA